MGIIGSIRKRSGIIIILIAIALGGFILMEIVQNQSQSSGVTDLGKVDGKTIDFNEMRYMEDMLYRNSDADEFSKRDYIWSYLSENIIANNESNKIGLSVGKQELLDLEFGKYKSQLILQRFGNPQTGQANEEQLNQIKQMIKDKKLPQEMIGYWSVQEKEIIKSRLVEKLSALAAQAVYYPTWQADALAQMEAEKLNVKFVQIPYSTIGDNDIKLEDSDYEKYFKENKKKFVKPYEERMVSILNLILKPTKADSNKIFEAIKLKVERFSLETDDSSFVISNNGTISNKYEKIKNLSPVIKDHIAPLSAGQVYGPYYDENKVKLVKVISVRSVPDSVRSSHILISADTPEKVKLAEAKIDSIEIVIRSGKNTFVNMVEAFSQDPGSKIKKGDLGFLPQGALVKPYDDAIFFEMKKGQYKKVITQFGVHLVLLTDLKNIGPSQGYKLAFITSELAPSESTIEVAEEQADIFLRGVKTLDQLNTKMKQFPQYAIEPPIALQSNTYIIQSLPLASNARDIVKWAFEKDIKVGDVSQKAFAIQELKKYYPSMMTIAAITGIKYANSNNAMDFKDEIKAFVSNNKKAEIIMKKIGTTSDLEALANTNGVKVDTVKNIGLSANFIPKIGSEPALLGKIFSVALGNNTSPVIGNKGIYVARPYEKSPGTIKPAIDQIRAFFTSSTKRNIANKVMPALKEKSKIIDNRSLVY